MYQMIKLMYRLFRYSRIAGVLCFLAVWRMLFMGCSKRRYLRTSSIHFLYWVIDFYEKILILHDNLPSTLYIPTIYRLFFSCGAGSLVFPPLSAFVFSSSWWGPQGVMHLTLIACLMQCIVYGIMYFISKRT